MRQEIANTRRLVRQYPSVKDDSEYKISMWIDNDPEYANDHKTLTTTLELLHVKFAYEFAFDTFPEATSLEKIREIPNTEERVTRLLFEWRDGYYRDIANPYYIDLPRRHLYALMHEHYSSHFLRFT